MDSIIKNIISSSASHPVSTKTPTPSIEISSRDDTGQVLIQDEIPKEPYFIMFIIYLNR